MRTLPAVKTVALFALFSFTTVTVHAEWTVDFSRRAKAIRESDLSDAAHGGDYPSIDTARQPASIASPTISPSGNREANPSMNPSMNPTVAMEDIGKRAEPQKGVLDQIFDAGEPVQEIVILNTEKGFVPNTVRVRKNARYKISVVNVNEKEKNVSFILDGFSEHHATYFGKVKTFVLNPNKEGVFSFQSPETAAEGKLVVYNPPITVRNPASEKINEGSLK
jgi:hypothetical protein